MSRRLVAAAGAIALALAVAPAALPPAKASEAPQLASAADCRLALVLGLDISSSVNSKEYAIQLEGLARAFRVPEVIEAILTPAGSGIAVTAFEWSGQRQQSEIAPWTMLDSETAIAAFASRLLAHSRTAADQATAVGSALRHAAGLFRSAPPCTRWTIDLSGDGANNEGPQPKGFRAQGLFDGITINGLVVQGEYPNPAIFYRAQVMHGPDAFVAMARDFTDYPSVIIGKLLREIAAESVMGALR